MRRDQRLEIVAGDLAQAGRGVGIVRVELEQDLGDVRLRLERQRDEKRLLGVEIGIERALGDAGGLGDLAHARAVEAPRREHLARALEDLAALGLRPAPRSAASGPSALGFL